MKILGKQPCKIFVAVGLAAFVIASCNQGRKDGKSAVTDTSAMNTESTSPEAGKNNPDNRMSGTWVLPDNPEGKIVLTETELTFFEPGQDPVTGSYKSTDAETIEFTTSDGNRFLLKIKVDGDKLSLTRNNETKIFKREVATGTTPNSSQGLSRSLVGTWSYLNLIYYTFTETTFERKAAKGNYKNNSGTYKVLNDTTIESTDKDGVSLKANIRFEKDTATFVWFSESKQEIQKLVKVKTEQAP